MQFPHTGARAGRSRAVAEVVQLPVLRDLAPALDEDSPVSELLSAVDRKDAEAILVQAVIPYRTVSVKEAEHLTVWAYRICQSL